MRVISSSELRNTMKKYLELATNERIVIQRRKNETFVLIRVDYLEPYSNFNRSISSQEILVGIEADIRKAYREKYNKTV